MSRLDPPALVTPFTEAAGVVDPQLGRAHLQQQWRQVAQVAESGEALGSVAGG